MLGNFTFCNPTRVHFGENSILKLNEELPNFGTNVTLIYGGGSIKKNGIYDKVIELLKANGKVVSEISGVMPNPTLEKLYEGIKIAREAKTDLILAVGGGSVIDYAKAVAVSVNEEEDPWEKYFTRFEEPTCKVVPVASILTMVGTGSEMNTGSVITNKEKGLKVGQVFRSREVMPKFSIMDPTYSYSIPHYQMVSGIYDIFNHISEQYFSNEDDNTSDYLAEGLMKSLIVSSKVANVNPKDYEARSNIMWTSTWALNGLIGKGKRQDWNVHMLGQAIGAITDAAHGMTLAVVSLPYYKWIMPYGLDKFVRFAKNVWNVSVDNKSKEEIALEGLAAMESWMKELGIVLDGRELGMKEENIDAILNATEVSPAGYRGFKNKEEIREILIKSMK